MNDATLKNANVVSETINSENYQNKVQVMCEGVAFADAVDANNFKHSDVRKIRRGLRAAFAVHQYLVTILDWYYNQLHDSKREVIKLLEAYDRLQQKLVEAKANAAELQQKLDYIQPPLPPVPADDASIPITDPLARKMVCPVWNRGDCSSPPCVHGGPHNEDRDHDSMACCACSDDYCEPCVSLESIAPGNLRGMVEPPTLPVERADSDETEGAPKVIKLTGQFNGGPEEDEDEDRPRSFVPTRNAVLEDGDDLKI